MKHNKFTSLLAVLAFTLTACVENYEPVSRTQRGEEIYRVWFENFTEYNICYISTLFWLDDIIQLTPEQRDSLLLEDYGDPTILQINDDNTCLLRWGRLFGDDYSSYTHDSRMLVKTDGNSLRKQGARWDVILNIPTDYVYNPTEDTAQTARKSPPEPQSIGFYAYPDFLPFTIECIDNRKWTLKDLETAETTESFSVNYTMEQTQIGTNPDLFMTDHVLLNGNGRILAKRGVAIDFQFDDYELASNARGVAGCVSLTAIELATGKQVSTQVGCSATGYDIHYRGLTTHHPY